MNETIEQIDDENNFIVNQDGHIDNAGIKTDLLNDFHNTNDNASEDISICGTDLKISKPQLYILCLLCPYFFLTSSYYSLFAPFFPVEALKKNISQTQVGLIFGVYQLAFLVLAPIFGKYVSLI